MGFDIEMTAFLPKRHAYDIFHDGNMSYIIRLFPLYTLPYQGFGVLMRLPYQ
ncbi:hypothetical protein G5B00_07525 [Parapedobacter sp. SGR-10]|uniref:hypothetical protein n=1 Tax=Parapedobacter sp. SGR-10 TaxID=2710879 RepID=UPI0013D13461|nr:hypothetical protein [Parapedobacter sp. SGR-10]NGF56364.1 hypothetical protein [Parapedobacter sp. SGR-10]